ITIDGNLLTIAGSKTTFQHELPEGILVQQQDKELLVTVERDTRRHRMLWGLHRALLANKVKGVETGFEQKLIIVGLGFKGQLVGQKLVLTLGYTHKIEYAMPDNVTVEIDKSGQQMMFRSADKFALGNVCDAVRAFRPPEPYKGTGIMREGEKIFRKAGKTKSS
ncbi:50S ribosomal protein L6, partial [bacterium]|nr:50S ribosomal protein L6 [bacterium]